EDFKEGQAIGELFIVDNRSATKSVSVLTDYKLVLYFSEVSREIDHQGDLSLKTLGTVARHSAIKANTYDGAQYLIERVKSKNPKESTDIIKITEKGHGVWRLDEFHHCKEGVTLGQLKNAAFSGIPYDLWSTNCQEATKQVANTHSASSASNEPAKNL
ncbi:10555_t:CDS:2, partial [Acaulospora colombiana]